MYRIFVIACSESLQNLVFLHCCREQWLKAAGRAFAELDSTGAGVLRSGQLLELLREKLPAQEVEYAVEDALLQGGHAGMCIESRLYISKDQSQRTISANTLYPAQIAPVARLH